MCGITGLIDLRGQEEFSAETLRRMANAIFHRGPDEDGYLLRPGVALANRRLSIVGLADGRQPIFNEDETVAVVFNGEFFDYPEKRAALEAQGHRFRTSTDTELLVHLWEQYGEDMLQHLRGQFAFALYDMKQGTVILARDRIGITPLHWARRGDRVYFGSEVKAILASGEVEAEVDPRGLDHIFTFFALPTRRTVFAGISAVYQGFYLKIQFQSDGSPAEIQERQYWDLDFPDEGDEYDPPEEQLFDEFEEVFRRAVELRLRADVPVVSYLSGGVDSTSVAAMVSRIRGEAVPTFTIKIAAEGFDETDRALLAAKTIGSKTTVITCDSERISKAYPKLVNAADSPVMDTSCAALYELAGEVHRQGYKVALTGEGADEALAGYPWFKTNRLLNAFNLPGMHLADWSRKMAQRINAPLTPPDQLARIRDMIGGPLAQADLYGLIMMGRSLFYRKDFLDGLDGHLAYEDLEINLPRLKKWAPLNQSLYLGYKTILPGLLMNHKGDRPAMHNSVETRYPFLDEDFVAFCAKVHPRWKLRGLLKDKVLLRRFAQRMLPPIITDRRKAMFRAPFANTFFDKPPEYVEQLLSRDSLAKSGYFDVDNVLRWRRDYHKLSWVTGKRLIVEMALAGVMATQLWHHTYFGGGLCDLPNWSPENNLRPSATV